MLLSLSIRNFVLIDTIDIEFGKGFTVFTGETGAGKSILLDAFGLILGNRAESRFIRKNADISQVTAEFDISANDAVKNLLSENDLSLDDDVIVVRRTLKPDGKSKAYINDIPVSTNLLQQIGEGLVEVHGQHDQKSLLNRKSHLQLLDEYAQINNDLQSVSKSYKDMRLAKKEYEEALKELEKARSEQDYIEHVLKELEAVNPQSGEEVELVEKRKILQNHEKISETINAAISTLESGNVTDNIRAASRVLEKAGAETAEIFSSIVKSLDSAFMEAQDAIDSLQNLASPVDGEAETLEQIEDRLFALRDLARKHRVDVESLPELMTKFREKIELLELSDEKISKMKDELNACKDSYIKLSKSISKKRKEAANNFEDLMRKELAPLKMEGCEIKIEFEELDENNWSSEGVDKVAFLVKTNPGSPFGPLSKIVSGGELSRFMLALKVVLSDVKSTPTLIFDEIDTGIGGATSDAVGKRLSLLSKKFQVLSVTHQPQIAAYGDAHLRVEKSSSGDSTITNIVSLKGHEKKEEVARMLAGSVITSEARAAAGKLMEAEQ